MQFRLWPHRGIRGKLWNDCGFRFALVITAKTPNKIPQKHRTKYRKNTENL